MTTIIIITGPHNVTKQPQIEVVSNDANLNHDTLVSAIQSALQQEETSHTTPQWPV